MRRIEPSPTIIRGAIGTREASTTSFSTKSIGSGSAVEAIIEALLATEGRLRTEIATLRQELLSEKQRSKGPHPPDSSGSSGGDGDLRLSSSSQLKPRFAEGVGVQFASENGTRATEPSLQVDITADASFRRVVSFGQVEQVLSGSSLTASLPQLKSQTWEEWPGNLKLRREILADDSQHIATLRSLAEYHKSCDSAYLTSKMGSADRQKFMRRCLCMRPDALRRLGFDMIGMVVLTFQSIYTPFALSWPSAVEAVDPIILACNVVFWLMDLCLNFVTGYYTKVGEVELRFHQVVRHYVKTWLLFDATCVVADILNAFPVLFDVDLFPEDAGPVSRGIRVLKLHRFIRVLLMVRMLRIAREINTFMQIHFSTTVYMLIQITALLLWLTHIVACCWYSLGRWGTTGGIGIRWIDMWEPVPPMFSPSGSEEIIDSKGPDDVGTTYQYATSYHWALAQISLGSHEAIPVNSLERLLAILCNLFGLLFAGTLMSVLSAAMIEVREVDWVRATSLRKLRHFLLQHEVALDIRMQVLRQVQDRVRPHDRMLAEKDIAALTVLSKGLLRQLRYFLYYEHLRDHPLLQVWGVLAEGSVKHLCREGISFEVLPHDDELFAVGAVSWATYYLVKGDVKYVQDASDGIMANNAEERITRGAWLSEATWWCYWQHVGTAFCTSACTFVAVPPESIAAVMSFDPAVRTVTVEYGTRFYQHVVSRTEDFVVDVEAKHVGVKGLLCFLPRDVHVLLGMSALQQVKEKRHDRRLSKLLRTGYVTRLQAEVLSGRSLVLLNSSGILHRQVALTVAQMENYYGDVLVELLTSDDHCQTWKPVVALPATKQQRDEEPSESLERMIKSRLQPLAGRFDNAKVELLSEMRNSHRFGIPTNYIKTCFKVRTNVVIDEIFRHFAVVLSSQAMTSKAVGARAWCPRRLRLMHIWHRIGEGFLFQGAEVSSIYAWMNREDMEILASGKDLLPDLVKLEFQADGDVKFSDSQIRAALSSSTSGGESPTPIKQLSTSRLEPCEEDGQDHEEDAERSKLKEEQAEEERSEDEVDQI